jgi:hypothetical protein
MSNDCRGLIAAEEIDGEYKINMNGVSEILMSTQMI